MCFGDDCYATPTSTFQKRANKNRRKCDAAIFKAIFLTLKANTETLHLIEGGHSLAVEGPAKAIEVIGLVGKEGIKGKKEEPHADWAWKRVHESMCHPTFYTCLTVLRARVLGRD